MPEITRTQVIDAVKTLGLDPNKVVSLYMDHGNITVVYRPYRGGGGSISSDHFRITEDEPELDDALLQGYPV